MAAKLGFTEEPISALPKIHRLITTHDERSGQAIIHSFEPGLWQPMRNNTVALDLVYTTSEFPVQMNNDVDIQAHDKLAEKGVGLVNPSGSLCRMVDFSPSNNPMMHRTKSLDYGVVLEGEIELILDSGEKRTLKRGDVAVQRGTMHAWRNPSTTQWARMMFVLLDSHTLQVGSTSLNESLAPGQHEIQASGNDG
jgi:quercetin dioxygenase-like cupin family protein